MSLPYLDIHTHRRLPLENATVVSCLSIDELKRGVSFEYISSGIHPWWLEDYTKDEIIELKGLVEKLARTQTLWAIGETGIDRTYPEFLEEQRELFKWHLTLAHELQLPIVIHNVRAGADFLQIMKENKPQTPWIFHDFRGNETLVRDILRLHPEAYFSFGLSLDNSPQVREVLPLVPLENLFLETDSQKHLDIHDIYLRAAECLRMDLNLLKSQIWHNFQKISEKNPRFKKIHLI